MEALILTRVVEANQDLPGLKYELERFRLGGAFQLREDERVIGTLGPGQVSFDVAYSKLIFSCWDEGWSKSWRVVSGEVDKSRLRLACTKKMGLTSCTLELRRAELDEYETVTLSSSAAIKQLIESNLAGVTVTKVLSGADPARGLSGCYKRLIIKHQGARPGTISAAITLAGRDQTAVDGLLAAGLVWVDVLRTSGQWVSGLFIFAPYGQAVTIASRLTMMESAPVPVRLYELDEESGTISAMSPFDQGDLSDNLRKAAERVVWPDEILHRPETNQLAESVVAIAPEFIKIRVKEGGVSLSIRGLEFAHLSNGEASSGGGRLYFGLGAERTRLVPGKERALRDLVWKIVSERAPFSENRNGDLYRAQSERWLESIVETDASAIDPNLDPDRVYSQVPAYRGDRRTYIDLLAVTRAGRLVVIELKTAEDPEFPLQGLDYWLRVNWHARRGDFERRGYFRGVRLSPEPPLLYLVAPIFRFHATTRLLGGTFSKEVPVYRIGINEDWRAGIRVLMRERLN
ncbi:MAG TPA: hypothetical protein VI756_23705 [Blastocatellia bacterium]